MKVKWTTITEDEATWPPRKEFFILELGESIRDLFCNEELIYVRQEQLRFPSHVIGMQWRPMPKPPKRQQATNINAQEYLNMKPGDIIGKFTSVQMEILKNISEMGIQSTKKSPWKSTIIKPKLGSYFIVRGNGKVSGIYCYEMLGYNNIPGLTDIGFCTWQEWMEIPE